MITREHMLDIISGQNQAWWANWMRFGLWTLTPIYGLFVSIRNRRFDRAAALRGSESNASANLLIRAVEVPVISVGNLTTGGTGKTPLVIYLCELLQDLQHHATILSRGYGAVDDQHPNDEALELQYRLPGIPHLQSPNRFAMAQQAVQKLGADVIVLDDGFQHRRLHRDLDIVLIDCTNPFGYGHLLPRGLLREPLSSLRRCQALVLTRCELVSEERREQLLRQLEAWQPNAVLAAVQTNPGGWWQIDGRRYAIEQLRGQAVFAFCGIGNPQNFLATLQRIGLNLTGSQLFPDHHNYSKQDLSEIIGAAKSSGARVILCTHKDLVKVQLTELGNLPLYSLLIETQFLSGQTELVCLVKGLFQ